MLYFWLWFIMLCVLTVLLFSVFVFFFKQRTSYEMRISDWSSDVCSSDLVAAIASGRKLRLPAIAADADLGRAVLHAIAVRYGESEAEVGVEELPPLDHALRRIVAIEDAVDRGHEEIGSASCRARVCQYV